MGKEQLSIILQVIKKLLSFKADKEELRTKIDKSELETPIELSAELGLVEPVVTENEEFYTDENGVLYLL